MIIAPKFIIIGLSLALTAFTISTIVLAVQKAEISNELEDTQNKVESLEEQLKRTTTTTTTTTAPSTSFTSPSTTTTNNPTFTTENTNTTPEQETINYRLSGDVIPYHYDLYLNPDIETGTFAGQEIINVKALKDITSFELHSLYLNITDFYISGPFIREILYIKSYRLDTVREMLIAELSTVMPANTEFEIGVLFEGEMEGKIVGLYSSSYTKSDGSKKRIATSKFEPTYARQSFPCFDEPAMKANFTVTLVHPNSGNYHALSNMDVDHIVNQGLYSETYFRTSVPMSTYLTVFVVSDFDFKTVEVDTKGIGEVFNISVYATPEQISKVDFSLDVAKKVIEFYIDYFNVPYPLPKLDMAAIPDFVSGAMETWGLVTYRETSLLYEEGISSTVNKQSIATTVAHELAHMWFGNLVTMKWWNDLWLNEGFADFIEFKGVNARFPEWNMEDQFLTLLLHSVLTTDSSVSSHPIIQTVSNPDEITAIFDTITYNKGASIIRMLENFITSTNFELAVTNYLTKYKFKNAVTSDFLTEIDNLNLGINVTDIMRTWTEQMGFPVVEITQLSSTQFRLTQKRFLSNPDEYNLEFEYSPFNYRWSVPVTYYTDANSTVISEWFYYNESEKILNVENGVKWIKLNKNQVGYYRVNYPIEMWQSLAAALIENPYVFSVSDRAHLLNDAFALADSTQVEYEISLDIMSYLSKETQYVPWSVAASRLVSLKNKLMFTEAYQNYLSFSRSLVAPIVQNVGWTFNEEHLENRLRITILNAACSLGEESCVKEAGERFNSWLANPDVRPDANVRSDVYYYGMMAVGNVSSWEKMWEIFINETDATEKSKLMSGLSAVQVPWLLQKFINLAWDEKYVRSQDYFTCLSNIAANPIGESLVWDHVREHWQDLVDRFTINERYLGSMIPSITAKFHTQTKLEEMEAFFKKYPEAGAGKAARERALSTVKNNISWLKNNLNKVNAWLEQQVS